MKQRLTLAGAGAAPSDEYVYYVKTFSGETYSQIWRAGQLGINPPEAVTTQTTDWDVMPEISSSGTRVIFLRLDLVTTFDYQLWIADADGANETLLDNGGGSNVQACMWNPDESTIVYRIGNNIYTIEPDGSNKTLLVTRTSARRPTFNHDGTRIAYLATGSTLWIMDSDGSNDTNVASATAGTVEGLAWSNDDRLCYFYAPTIATGTVRVINGDGTGDSAISSYPNPDRPGAMRRAWSPDDSTVYFFRGGGAPWEMWTADSGGGGAAATGIDMEADSGQAPFVFGDRVVYVDDNGDLISRALDLSDPITLDTGFGAPIEMQFDDGF